jgi:hypothetical protein
LTKEIQESEAVAIMENEYAANVLEDSQDIAVTLIDEVQLAWIKDYRSHSVSFSVVSSLFLHNDKWSTVYARG